MNLAEEAPRTRRGGRGSRRELRSAIDTAMLPALQRKLPPVELMDETQIERIDRASLDILEDVGVIFRDPQAIADWKSVGADIRDDDRVHLDRGLVRDLITSIPESFTYHARNPANNLPFGNDHSIFVPMTGAPYLRDLEDRRRGPTLDDGAGMTSVAGVFAAGDIVRGASLVVRAVKDGLDAADQIHSWLEAEAARAARTAAE